MNPLPSNEQILISYGPIVSTVLLKILIAFIIFAAFWLLGSFLERGVKRVTRQRNATKEFSDLAASVVKITLGLLGALTALSTIGLDVTAIIASLGLTGFAIGFALRDVLSNFISGAMLLLYRPFRVGDHISVTGFEGEVISMDLRYITLRSASQKILVPNSTVFTNPVTINNQPQKPSSKQSNH